MPIPIPRSFTSREIVMANEALYTLAPHSTGTIASASLCRQGEWQRLVRSGTLILFVFDKKDVDANSWSAVAAGNLVYKKYYLTYSDLMASSCTVTVP